MNKSFRINKSHLILLAYWAIASLVILGLCSRSSFLYPANNWDDANSYFTMGKAMFRGKVIYRDLFDQKGPYLYFLYGLASLISYTTFKGVYLLEVLLGILDLAAIYRILRLFLRRGTSLVLTPLTLALMFSSYCYYWGGAAEEICMPVLLWVLYLTIRNFPGLQNTTGPRRSIRPYDHRTTLLAGVLTGLVLCTKFTLLGFLFTYMMFVFLSSWNREDGEGCVSFGVGLRRFLISCVVFLAGMFLPCLPWLVYFAMHGALGDWYRVYIYTNVFLYSSWGANDSGEPWSVKLMNMATVLRDVFERNLQYFVLIVLGAVYGLFRRNAGVWSRFAIPMCYVFTAFAIYIGGGRLPYYALPFTALTVCGLVPVGLAVERICGAHMNVQRAGLVTAVACAVATVLSGVLCHAQSMNTYYADYHYETDLFLSAFEADIRSDGLENPTLLNMNCLDCGLYTVTGIIPNCYWFQTQTLPEPDVYEIQKDYYRAHEVDYVVYRGDDYPESLTDNYDLIDSFTQVMSSETFDYPDQNYHLFRLKGVMN